jgi:hypothetical protein
MTKRKKMPTKTNLKRRRLKRILILKVKLFQPRKMLCKKCSPNTPKAGSLAQIKVTTRKRPHHSRRLCKKSKR